MERLVAATTAILVVDVQEKLAAAMPDAATEAVAFDLLEHAGTGAFKAIAKLLR